MVLAPLSDQRKTLKKKKKTQTQPTARRSGGKAAISKVPSFQKISSVREKLSVP